MMKQLNGAKLSILNNRLEGVARKMGNTLLRTGRSGVLNRARDFSCCIVTADSYLLATAESLPIHVLSGPDMMAEVMKQYHPDLRRGDAFLNNSPYHGCSHAADHTLLVPVLDNEGVHRFTVLAKAHQADIGNSIPTTYHGAARDVYEEGALIFPTIRVQKDYEDIPDFLRMCEMRIRVPSQWRGDYLAMVGAARIGEREILALADEIGWDTLEGFAEQWFDYSEQRMSIALKSLPSGKSTATSTHDPFPGTPSEGIEVKVHVAVDSENGLVEVDLQENMDSLPCGLNLSEACARTSAMIGIFNSIDHTVPKNAGSFRRIQVLLRDGCVTGVPKHPTSCSVATTNVADRVANAVQRAVAELAEGFGMAECGAVIPPSAGVISGIDPDTDQYFVNQVFLGFTGGAAAPTADAWVTIGHVGNAGSSFQDSVELDELAHPLIVHERRLIPDTEGAGRYCGAPSIRVEYGPIRGCMEIGYVSDGVINGPRGARGGLNGGCASQKKRSVDGQISVLPACSSELLRCGETVISVSCGGGGYGSPFSRDPSKVCAAVADGLLSVTRAEDIYGVRMDPDGGCDQEKTLELRDRLSKA